ncbi:MAG: hypothetical protein ACI9D0_001401, partial [Bacteroidia bacterium]
PLAEVDAGPRTEIRCDGAAAIGFPVSYSQIRFGAYTPLECTGNRVALLIWIREASAILGSEMLVVPTSLRK